MSEKELAKALLSLGASELPEPPSTKELIRRILSRDRKLVQLLTVLAIFFWLGGVVVLYVFMAELSGLLAQVQQAGRPALDPLIGSVYKFLLVLASSVESLSLAFLCTMILLFATRRASLRQINASLLDITEKLERLEQGLTNQAK
jgi:Zn-dependent protease with chaperone function